MYETKLIAGQQSLATYECVDGRRGEWNFDRRTGLEAVQVCYDPARSFNFFNLYSVEAAKQVICFNVKTAAL